MTEDTKEHTDFFPPTSLESSVRSLGADAGRYQVDYVMLAMRDGVRLATVIIRPRSEGRRPTFMIRTPYETSAFERTAELMKALFEAEYVVIVQNERGTEWSEGEFGFLTKTTADAQDTLDWVAEREWSNGRVGLYGCSSPAENQLRLAAIGHPALRACVAMSSGAGVGSVPGNEASQGMFYRGGVPMLKTWALWYAPFGIRNRPKLPRVDSDDEMSRILRRYSVSAPAYGDPEYATALNKSLRQAPSGEVLRRMGAPLTGYERFMAVGPKDSAWDDVDLIDASHTGATPSLNINGWLDPGAYETVKLFEFQQHHPDQYLIMAPTEHCAMVRNAAAEATLGDRPMGDTRLPYDEITTSWFGRWLRDDPDAWKPMPKVQVFLMGAGTWLTGDAWPLPDSREQTLFLASGGSANTLWGDGVLSPEALLPGAVDHFIADPHNPVPSIGGFGEASPCLDQRPAECRADVLVYSTPPLADAVSIVGDVTAELYVSADVPDTDIFVKLVDVYPDGTAYNVADTCLRLRYRDSLSAPEPLVSGQIYRIELRGITTANHFPSGHRIRIEIAGSSFPYRDRNWNTGGQNELADDGPTAHITLHHGPDHPSLIRFREYTGEIAEVKD